MKLPGAQDCGQQPSRPTPTSALSEPGPESAAIHQTPKLETQVRMGDSILTSDEVRNRAFDSFRDNETSSEYRHSPLSEQGSIRLLRLMPHKDKKALIQCQLFEYPLQGEGTHLYEALSYVWGSEDNRQPIYIQPGNKIGNYSTAEMERGLDRRSYPPTGNNFRLLVTANLHTALSHLRDCLIERIIWIDAISINQEDNDEKGQQVQAMAKIYAKASRVIVWLGEAAGDSDQALRIIRKAAEEHHTNPAIDETNQQAILNLLERQWFQRIWVSGKQSTMWARVINIVDSGPSGGCRSSTCLDQVWSHGD